MKKLSIKCPAKLNLFLNIRGKRNDGFHELYLINDTVSLYDEIIICESNVNGIKIECNDENIPIDESNSVYKMAKLFFEYNKINDYKVKIIIRKGIPLESGMGGESTDAAGTLVLLDKLYNTNMSIQEKIALGAVVGSDVPFFIIGGRCVVQGRGEIVKAIKREKSYYYVIIKPQYGFSTKEMFSKIKEYKKLNLVLGHNDFEVVVSDKIKEIKDSLEEYNPMFAMMTGSGSSIYAAFLSYEEALCCYEKLKNKYENIYIVNEVN